ncbi:MAG: CarD family transcriptional regulator [Roseiarcus sp.]|jgi:CarD family transcriptional regulator|uniref:CarD family transcriptional regulator n=1 Tax=Roseiarcus sp. TaxID=1969460 RepID=UPI003C2581BE
MAARKKASKKGSGTITKKTKAPVRSTASRKRKPSAAASAPRRTAKAKTARNAKAKTDKVEAKRRAARAAASAAAKRRARSASAVPAAKPVAAKAGKAAAAKPVVNEAAKAAAAKPAVDGKVARAAVQAPRPAAAAPAKPAAPLGKRAPFPVKGRPVDVAAAIETESAAVRSARPASGPRQGFKVSEFVVYPAHGVGQIVAVEDQEVAGFRLELFVINFAKDKMTLRVPTSKVVGVGMRKLSDPDAAKRSLEILTGRARVKRTMWSRRAQEYEAKINSGDINAIAEVVRDLYRSEAQPEQSYSERQLYEAALDRIMREIAAVQKLSEIDALKLIESHLKKSQRRAAKADAADGEEAAVEEAA